MTNSNKKIEEATVDLVGNKYAAKTIAKYCKNLRRISESEESTKSIYNRKKDNKILTSLDYKNQIE